jgi:aconitate hydratase
MYLGVRVVIAKSFARIHIANLINFGIVPMTLVSEEDYEKFSEGDEIYIEGFKAAIAGRDSATLVNRTTGATAELALAFTARQREILLAGGTLNYTKMSAK